MTPSRMRSARSSAAASAAPLETPTSNPSSVASRRVKCERALGRHADIFVGERRVVNPRPDRRLHVLQPFDPVEGRLGLDRDEANVMTERAQAAARAHERAARTEPGDEMRHAAIGLLEDLDGGGVVVRPPVGVVVVLIGVEVLIG